MRRLGAFFKENAEIRLLAGAAGKLAELQRIWDGIVPAALRPHARAGGVKHRRITILVDNGAVASRLKLLAPNLLKNLQNKGVEVTSIRFEVQAKSRPEAASRPPRTLSGEAAASLARLADALPDSPLKQSLQRLAGRR